MRQLAGERGGHMKRFVYWLLLGLLALVLAACGDPAPTVTPAFAPATATSPAATATTAPAESTAAPATADRVSAAKQFVADLHAGKFDVAESGFDATMKTQMPADKLRDTWA